MKRNVRRSSTRGRPRRRRASARSRTTVRRAVRKAKNTIFRRRVMSVVNRAAETKHFSVTRLAYLQQFQTGGSVLSSNIQLLSPGTAAGTATFGGWTINQGTTDGARIGTRVRVKKAYFNVSIFPNAYSLASNALPTPQVVRMFFYRAKLNNASLPVAGDFNGGTGNFFSAGTSQAGFNGNLVDMNQLVNTDRYTLYHYKTLKIGFASNNGTGAGAQPNLQYLQNNDFAMNYTKRIDITKFFPKILQWDDNGNITNPYVWCLIQCVNADGTAPNTLTTSPLSIQSEVAVNYNDI